MIWVAAIILCAYCALLVVFMIGWSAIKEKRHVDNDEVNTFYSIVVPVRNEEINLPLLLQSFDLLNFPLNQFEVILVDDHSEDNSELVFENHQRESEISLHWIRLEDETGKKAALNQGIIQSNGHVIVTTDADCVVSPDWLNTYHSFYQNPETKMVFGPVAFHSNGCLFNNLQQIEFLSLIGAGAASLQLKAPNMCNGANLSFSKEAFLEVGGYKENKHLASGDDEFLMHAIYRKYPYGVHFNKSEKALVNTYSSKDMLSFFSQRKRWASKWNHYNNSKAKYMALFIATANLVILYSLLSSLISPSFTLIGLLILKIVLEGIFIYRVMNLYKKPFKILHFLLLEICYPFYVVLFGIASNFGAYVWKGRKF